METESNAGLSRTKLIYGILGMASQPFFTGEASELLHVTLIVSLIKIRSRQELGVPEILLEFR